MGPERSLCCRAAAQCAQIFALGSCGHPAQDRRQRRGLGGLAATARELVNRATVVVHHVVQGGADAAVGAEPVVALLPLAVPAVLVLDVVGRGFRRSRITQEADDAIEVVVICE